MIELLLLVLLFILLQTFLVAVIIGLYKDCLKGKVSIFLYWACLIFPISMFLVLAPVYSLVNYVYRKTNNRLVKNLSDYIAKVIVGLNF